MCVYIYIYIYISAVKRLKYLITINRIYVIVNSKLIAINRKFLSILNVPSFIYFFHHFIFILTWKSELACFMQMFYFIENPHCQIGRYTIKFQAKQNSPYSAVKPWLNIVFFFFKFAGNIAVRPLISETMNRNRLPIKGKPTTSLLSASCLLTFSDNSEARFFCTTPLLKVNFPFRSFLSSIAVSRSPFTQTVTFAYYTVCEAKKNVYLKKKS